MSNIKIHDTYIEVLEQKRKPKKLTGTRFANVMGLNNWSTPFETWCAITRTYEKPFEENIYTHAGKVIEPKVVEYLRDVYFMELRTPEDVWGQDYFKQTWGDFYPEEKIFGGMWDAIGDDYIVEIKTTKRAEDWLHGIPIYYKLQAALYAYLSGFDDVIVTVSFLQPRDYDKPEEFIPNVENTKVFEFKMSEDFPNFEEDYILPAKAFWKKHVETGISPEFDERKDAEVLKELRTNYVEADESNIAEVLAEADKLLDEINRFDDLIKDKRKKLKALENKIKDYMLEQFNEDDTRVEITSDNFIWTTSKSVRKTFNKKALEKEHPDLVEKYEEEKETYTLRKKAVDKD